jgi:hypothetical protein
MTAGILKPPSHEDLLEGRLEVDVTSPANPSAENLLQARADLNRDSGLRQVLDRFRSERRSRDWLADVLAVRMAVLWGNSVPFSDVFEVCAYLADEAEQLGEGIYLASPKTGKVQAVLSEEDLYQPGMVPREGGGLAQPLKRVRPDLEAAIICHYHEKEREERILQILREKLPSTQLLVDGFDPRLRMATRAGRSNIVQSVAQLTPKSLLEAAGGTTGAFLRYLELVTEDTNPDPAWQDLGEHIAVARSRMGIQDPTTINLQYNREAALRGIVPQQWVRGIASWLAEHVCKERAPVLPVPVEDLTEEDLAEVDFWLLPPDAFPVFERLQPRMQAMPLENIHPVGIVKGARLGRLVVDSSFGASSHELFSRWETEAHLKYRLYLNPKAVYLLRLSGLAHAAVVV